MAIPYFPREGAYSADHDYMQSRAAEVSRNAEGAYDLVRELSSAKIEDRLSTSESQDQAFLEQLNKERARLREAALQELAQTPLSIAPVHEESVKNIRFLCYEATGNLADAKALYAWVSGEGKS